MITVPAFPNITTNGSDSDAGMTLRDYFAAKAIVPLLDDAVLPTKEDRDEWLPVVAQIAYEMADAMMKARGGE